MVSKVEEVDDEALVQLHIFVNFNTISDKQNLEKTIDDDLLLIYSF